MRPKISLMAERSPSIALPMRLSTMRRRFGTLAPGADSSSAAISARVTGLPPGLREGADMGDFPCGFSHNKKPGAESPARAHVVSFNFRNYADLEEVAKFKPEFVERSRA